MIMIDICGTVHRAGAVQIGHFCEERPNDLQIFGEKQNIHQFNIFIEINLTKQKIKTL